MYGFVPDAPTPYDAVTLDGAYSDEDVAAMEAADAPSDMLEEKRHLLESNRYGPPRCFGITGRQVDLRSCARSGSCSSRQTSCATSVMATGIALFCTRP